MNNTGSSPPRLIFAQDTLDEERQPFAFGQLVAHTRKCPGREGPNQDSAMYLDLGEAGAILAVADGMGGLPAGDVASRVALEALAEVARSMVEQGKDLRHAILDGFDKGNQDVLDLKAAAGTTLAVVSLREGAMRSYHVGDSNVMVVGQRGKLKHFSTSHSPVGYAVEAGLLDAREALHHDERHVISNALGSPEMKIEIGPRIVLAQNDTLVVASDGLWDNMHLEEVVQRVRCGPMAAASTELCRLSVDRMHTPGNEGPSKPDDLTMLVFRPRR